MPKKLGKKTFEKQLQEMKETLQHVQAEFENHVKRVEKEKMVARERGFSEAIGKILPVLDSVDAAVENARKAGKISKQEALNGLEQLRKQLKTILEAIGLKEIDCVGKPFNPEYCDVVMVGKEKDKEDDVVIEEMQKGYMLNGKVLRHAKVKVNKVGK